MRKLLSALIVISLFSSSVIADCPDDVYDYDSGNYLYNTDAEEKCEEAVNSAVEEACYEGYRKCRNECSDSDCEDACRAGKRACENSI